MSDRISVRCKHCCRFYERLAALRKADKHSHSLYMNLFKANSRRRRAFILRSHTIPALALRSWIKEQLRAMSSKDMSLKDKNDPGACKTTHSLLIRVSIDGPTFHHNDTGADMNPVVSSTQEHPIVISLPSRNV